MASVGGVVSVSSCPGPAVLRSNEVKGGVENVALERSRKRRLTCPVL